MKHILFIAIFSALIGLVACGDKQVVTDVLNRAETLMDEHPDSSLVLLRTLTFDDFRKESNRARYALLHSQALDKNYIDVTSDSLISVAVEYYKDKDDVRGKFLSYYYEGRVHINAENLMKAMLSFSKAEQLGGELQDSLALGLLYSNLGDIYREYYDFPKSLASYQKAEACYGQASKEQHRLYAMLDQAEIVRNMGDVEESYRLLKEVQQGAERINNKKLDKTVLGNLFILYVKEERFEEAQSLYDELRSRYGLKDRTVPFWGYTSRLFASQNDESKALQALIQGWNLTKTSKDSVIMYNHAAKVYEHFKQPEKAYEYVVAATLLQNELVRVNLQQPILTIQNNYLSDELRNQIEKVDLEKRLRIVSTLLIVVVAVIVIYFLQRVIRERYLKKLQQREAVYSKELQRLKDILMEKEQHVRIQVEQLNAEIIVHESYRRKVEELKCEIVQKDESFHLFIKEVDRVQEEQQVKQRELHALAGKLFASRTKLVNDLLDCIYSDADNKDLVRQRLALLMEQVLKEYGPRKSVYLKLEQTVDECYGGIMQQIRAKVLLPDEESYQQVCYHLAGFSVKVIALLMGDTPNKIYKRRDRIRAKMGIVNELMDKYLLRI